MTERESTSRVAVIGCGHWGKNLVRNFHRLGALESIVEATPAGRKVAAELAPDAAIVEDFEVVLQSDVAVDGRKVRAAHRLILIVECQTIAHYIQQECPSFGSLRQAVLEALPGGFEDTGFALQSFCFALQPGDLRKALGMSGG